MKYYISWLILFNELQAGDNDGIGFFLKLQKLKKSNFLLYRGGLHEIRTYLKKQRAERLYYEKCAWVQRDGGKYQRFPIVGEFLGNTYNNTCLCRDAETGKEYGVIIRTGNEKRGFNIL